MLLTDNRNALNLVARNLLEHETLSGDEVNRLIAVANEEPMPPAGSNGGTVAAAPAPAPTPAAPAPAPAAPAPSEHPPVADTPVWDD